MVCNNFEINYMLYLLYSKRGSECPRHFLYEISCMQVDCSHGSIVPYGVCHGMVYGMVWYSAAKESKRGTASGRCTVLPTTARIALFSLCVVVCFISLVPSFKVFVYSQVKEGNKPW